MLLQQRWEHPCAKDVPSLPVLGAMSCVSPVLCWTIPKQRWEGVGDRAGSSPEREGDMGQRSGLSCSCRESSESSWIPGASRVRDPASPGLISHPPAQGRFHILQPIQAIFPKAAASAGTQLLQRCLPRSGRSLLVAPCPEQLGEPRYWSEVLAVPPEPPPAPRARRIPGRASPAANTALYFNPAKGLLGSEAEPGCAELRMNPYF